MNLEIKKLSPQELDSFVELISIFEEVFEMENFSLPDKAHLQDVLNNPQLMVFVAKSGSQVIAGLTVHILKGYYSAKPSAYIYDLGVLPAYQRKGIGKKLIATLQEYCRQNGFEDMFVQAETGDKEAVNFYRTTPISDEMPALQFSYSLENRPD